MATILLIDDDDQIQKLVKIVLEDAGYRFVSADNGKHGLHLLEHQEVDVVLVDIFMPEMDGMELIRVLRKTRFGTKIIAITAGFLHLDVAKQEGANDTLSKPFTRQELLKAVASQLGQPNPASDS